MDTYVFAYIDDMDLSTVLIKRGEKYFLFDEEIDASRFKIEGEYYEETSPLSDLVYYATNVKLYPVDDLEITLREAGDFYIKRTDDMPSRRIRVRDYQRLLDIQGRGSLRMKQSDKDFNSVFIVPSADDIGIHPEFIKEYTIEQVHKRYIGTEQWIIRKDDIIPILAHFGSTSAYSHNKTIYSVDTIKCMVTSRLMSNRNISFDPFSKEIWIGDAKFQTKDAKKLLHNLACVLL